MPIDGETSSDDLRPDVFRVLDERERLPRLRVDPWRDVLDIRQRLPRSAAVS